MPDPCISQSWALTQLSRLTRAPPLKVFVQLCCIRGLSVGQ